MSKISKTHPHDLLRTFHFRKGALTWGRVKKKCSYGPCYNSIAAYDPVTHKIYLMGGTCPPNYENKVRSFDPENPGGSGTVLPTLKYGGYSWQQPFVREDSGDYVLHWVDDYDVTMRRYDMSNTLELADLSFSTGNWGEGPCIAFNRYV